MGGHWLAGHEDLTEGALWHGDGLGMLRALGEGPTPVRLIFSSPPYNVGKAYEKRMPLDAYLAWQTDVLQTCARVVAPGGCVVWQVGTWVDRRRGAVYPLDALLFPELLKLGLTSRNRIVWTTEHGLHATRRLSGRHETLLFFTKDRDDGSYPFYLDAIRVLQRHPGKRHYKGPRKGELSCHPLGKNPGDVWNDITPVKANHPERTGHPAQMPLALAERVIHMTTRPGDLVVDPFAGAGTTVVAARRLGRCAAGADLQADYLALGVRRLSELAAGTLPRVPSGAERARMNRGPTIGAKAKLTRAACVGEA
jgi:adenine-specific DNA-methyltransferase